MLSRPRPLPCGSGWSFELEWDGFRAIVSTEDGLRVRSRSIRRQKTSGIGEESGEGWALAHALTPARPEVASSTIW
jgi:ATP-dependent DNA ligase